MRNCFDLRVGNLFEAIKFGKNIKSLKMSNLPMLHKKGTKDINLPKKLEVKKSNNLKEFRSKMVT